MFTANPGITTNAKLKTGSIQDVQASYRKCGQTLSATASVERNKAGLLALVTECTKADFHPDLSIVALALNCPRSVLEATYAALEREGRLDATSKPGSVTIKGEKTPTETATEKYHRERAEKLANDSTRFGAPRSKGVLTEVLEMGTRQGIPMRISDLLERTGIPEDLLKKVLARLVVDGRVIPVLDSYWWIG